MFLSSSERFLYLSRDFFLKTLFVFLIIFTFKYRKKIIKKCFISFCICFQKLSSPYEFSKLYELCKLYESCKLYKLCKLYELYIYLK